MEDVIRGKAYVLGDNIDTDQIIPAHYLTLNPAIPDERKQFGRYALCGVPEAEAGLPDGHVPFVDHTDESNTRSEFSIIVAGRNFGCGSSREHAPLALAEAGVKVVVARFYARIFFRNSVNGGYLIPFEWADGVEHQIRTGDELQVRVGDQLVIESATARSHGLKPLGEVAPIIAAGDLFQYAKKTGML
jgi:3-isopropylmalate/(R)-2-methylmalate dehydratase small subunit